MVKKALVTIAQGRVSLQQCADGLLGLYPGKVGTKTQMASATKCKMLHIRSFDIKCVGVGVSLWIPVCRSQ